MRIAALATCTLILVSLVLIRPQTAQGCQSVSPTFDEVTQTASAIVDGRIIEVTATNPPYSPDRFTIEVDRVLRGTAGSTIVVVDRSSLCGDRIDGEVGTRLIIAVGVDFYGATLAPYWRNYFGRVAGTAHFPSSVHTLDQLAVIIARLPDTATAEIAVPAEPQRPADGMLALIVLTAFALFAIKAPRRIAARP